MADFGKIALTNTGINALVKVQAGSPLVFTKIKMGSGLYTGDIKTLSDLTEPKLTAEIVKGTALSNTYMVEAHFTNEGLTAGFYWREIGLYIKDGNGNDALFGYANAGTTADYIPATTSEIYSKHVRISVAVGDTANITVEHTTGTYVDIVTFEASMDGKVDKVEGKGLSANDYTDEEKEKLRGLFNYTLPVASVSTLGGIKSGGDIQVDAEGNVSLPNHTSTEELEIIIESINKGIEDLASASQTAQEENATAFTAINNKIGTGNISGLGDGSLSGAILALYEMITKIPSITSGTAEPSGGSDGDVYIMHE